MRRALLLTIALCCGFAAYAGHGGSRVEYVGGTRADLAPDNAGAAANTVARVSRQLLLKAATKHLPACAFRPCTCETVFYDGFLSRPLQLIFF